MISSSGDENELGEVDFVFVGNPSSLELAPFVPYSQM